VDQAEHVTREMERIREQTQGFIQQQQLVRQAQNKLERFQARIEKRQNEVAEMQRVAEDRLKRQWEEWQDKEDKQQKKRDVITEERWREQGRTNDVHLKRLDALRSDADQHRAQLDTLWEIRRSDTNSLLKSAQEKYEAETGLIDEQLSTLHSKPQEK